ncbi:hypothetical protein CS379_26240 [Methylobacterium frigidaeris]|uniref:hypothetical protein n=1 Tax=Methylobacterium frigidaeris TaxID=2038277 RepID=UPI000C185D80|nr:hypothetical protein [Methylobacterium frigidaeris]PIK70137.1 hypothetical protein CS379_26240 [Methylobacterium frigidaeris]
MTTLQVKPAKLMPAKLMPAKLMPAKLMPAKLMPGGHGPTEPAVIAALWGLCRHGTVAEPGR